MRVPREIGINTHLAFMDKKGIIYFKYVYRIFFNFIVRCIYFSDGCHCLQMRLKQLPILMDLVSIGTIVFLYILHTCILLISPLFIHYIPAVENEAGPDHLASDKASRSVSTLFIHEMNHISKSEIKSQEIDCKLELQGSR